MRHRNHSHADIVKNGTKTSTIKLRQYNKRSGYGYRNFRNLRYRVLISFSLTKKPIKPKEIYYKGLQAR